MKRKVMRLKLNRETIHRLDPAQLGHVGGAVPVETGPSICVTCPGCADRNQGGTASYDGTCNTCGICSGGCATGGACTVTCGGNTCH